MTIAYLGGLSVGGAAPAVGIAAAAGTSGIGSALPDFAARMAALIDAISKFTAFPPLTFPAQLVLANQIVTAITLANATSGLPGAPDLTTVIAQFTAQLAALAASVVTMQAQLDILTGLELPLAAAGIHAYAFDGATDALGGELSAELASGVPGGSGGTHANALALVTTSGASWAALGQILRVA